MSVRIVIVDDEAPARRRLRAHLTAEPEVEIVAEAGSGPEAVAVIAAERPDLVLLDIQMPGMTGFEVIEAIRVEAMPAVVFVTAYDEFAIDAFEVHAVDYLLKPYSQARLHTALERARVRIAGRTADQRVLTELLAAVRSSRGFLRRILVRNSDRLYFVPIADVIRFSADGNYVKVHTASGTHLIRETLSKLESQLDPEVFARIHRSEIVRIDAVKEIQPYFHGDHIVILRNGERVRLSRRYQGRLLRESLTRS